MQSTKSVFKALIILFLFGFILYLPGIGLKEFQGEEGRRVLLALEMLEKGEYLLPQLFGEPYFNKPPLFNLALALFFKLTGDLSEASARSFSALCIIFSALFLTYLWIKILEALQERSSISFFLLLLPGLIFLTTPELMDKALRAEIDAFYTMLITLGVFSWFYFYEVKARPYTAFIFLGVFLGLGILTKTFQALVFFYLAYLPYLIYQKRLKEFFSFTHLIGLLVMAFVFLCWAIPVSFKVGLKPFLYAWLSEYLSSAKAQEMSLFQHLEAYTLSAFLGFSPWLWFLFLYLKRDLRTFLKEKPILFKLFLFSAFFFGIDYLFHFLFPGARLRYMLPSTGGLTFLATLAVYYFLKEKPFLSPKSLVYFKVFSLISLLLLLLVSFYFYKTQTYFSTPLFIISILFVLFNLYFFFQKELSRLNFILYLVLFLFFIKQLYVFFYYPFHQKEMDYFRKGALALYELVKDKKELYLCKVVPHHLIYYLKYRYKLLEKIYYLKDCQMLPENTYVLFYEKDFDKETFKTYRVFPLEIRKKRYFLVYTGPF